MQHKEIQRKRLMEALAVRCAESPVTALLGARQVGKTTLARLFTTGRADVTWFDLETNAGREALTAMPEKTLVEKRGLVVIDEIQRMPDLGIDLISRQSTNGLRSGHRPHISTIDKWLAFGVCIDVVLRA